MSEPQRPPKYRLLDPLTGVALLVFLLVVADALYRIRAVRQAEPGGDHAE